MTLHLHPRAAPGDRLRVWVGAFGRTTAPRLSWRLDGAERVPEALAPVCGARPDELAEPGERRAFTGVYEFRGAGIAPGTLHVVEALDDTGGCAALECRTLPAEIPGLLENESFNVLLVSCFHADQDRNGLAGTVVSQLNGPYQPHLTLMMGDQVYLDLPVLENFPDSAIPLARKFEASYTRNWTDPLAYAEMLRAAPAVATGDDHEYWNNFPHPAPLIQNTWTAGGRARWTAAARALFGAFQLPRPEGWERAVELEVAPLSLFVMDTRTFRREDRSAALHPAVLAQFRAWAERVAREGKFGAVLSGQSLFEDPAGTLQGMVGDRTLANYGDYGEIVHALEGLADAGRPVLCLTGDVHWGRVMRAEDRFGGPARFYEVISSPTALVAGLGVGKALLTKLTGKRDPWPRHDEAAEAPDFFAPAYLRKRFGCEGLYKHRGNHMTLLRFNRTGSGLRLRVTYLPIYPSGRPGAPEDVEDVILSQT